MTVNEALRLIAGCMILISLYLAVTLSMNWLWFTVFIAVNLIQSSFTKWCLMMSILKKLGLKETSVSQK
ncbi:YgaP family membrane protein [Litorilituus sediminis]|uniref:DUF2892 domain-containing protein n=1 Tax=Litorilituus sediminis TaxID=718192 RepID=A0A4V0ZGG5_9GAMM|nr:DUF2892 domain-containing protein [Litorilituus sediminis]QBG37220.1 DUF2892 domain-containing protein [Litorilituus sediminis]